jgi:hypothetical protein
MQIRGWRIAFPLLEGDGPFMNASFETGTGVLCSVFAFVIIRNT